MWCLHIWKCREKLQYIRPIVNTAVYTGNGISFQRFVRLKDLINRCRFSSDVVCSLSVSKASVLPDGRENPRKTLGPAFNYAASCRSTALFRAAQAKHFLPARRPSPRSDQLVTRPSSSLLAAQLWSSRLLTAFLCCCGNYSSSFYSTTSHMGSVWPNGSDNI